MKVQSSRSCGILSLAFIAILCGCASTLPPPAPGIAETDSTLSAPIRQRSTESPPRKWLDFENILDPRSRDIEEHLGF